MTKVRAVKQERGIVILIETETGHAVPKRFRRGGLAGVLRFCEKYRYLLENPEVL